MPSVSPHGRHSLTRSVPFRWDFPPDVSDIPAPAQEYVGQSMQKLSFLPEAQNDMIFSIICEELGLFGAVAIILMFIMLLWRMMVIANNAPDLFGAMLVVGVMGHIAIQAILNIAVVTNSIPNTGISLPFISYGGSSALFLLSEIGLVLSVARRIQLKEL